MLNRCFKLPRAERRKIGKRDTRKATKFVKTTLDLISSLIDTGADHINDQMKGVMMSDMRGGGPSGAQNDLTYEKLLCALTAEQGKASVGIPRLGGLSQHYDPLVVERTIAQCQLLHDHPGVQLYNTDHPGTYARMARFVADAQQNTSSARLMRLLVLVEATEQAKQAKASPPCWRRRTCPRRGSP